MLTSRKLKRLAKRSTRQSGRKKQHHLSNAELVRQKGLGAYTKFVPLTPEQEMKTELFSRVHLSACRKGTGDEQSWLSVISGLMEGYLMSHFAFDELGTKGYARCFESAARLWDAAYFHFQRTGEVFDSNFDAIKDAIDLMSAMKLKMKRDELCAIINILSDNFDSYLVEMLGREPKSLSVNLGGQK